MDAKGDIFFPFEEREDLKKIFKNVSQQKVETKEILPLQFYLSSGPVATGKTDQAEKMARYLGLEVDAASENKHIFPSPVIIIDEKDKLDAATMNKFLDLMQTGFSPEEVERKIAERAEAEKIAAQQAEADEAARIARVTSPALQSDMPVRPPLQFRPKG